MYKEHFLLYFSTLQPWKVSNVPSSRNGFELLSDRATVDQTTVNQATVDQTTVNRATVDQAIWLGKISWLKKEGVLVRYTHITEGYNQWNSKIIAHTF